MNQLKVFNFKGNEVRSLSFNDEPWFVLKDLCSVLGLSNPTIVAERLEENERTKYNLGRQGMANLVNESGMYKIIFQSRKDEAKEFTTFVTSEILPTIRRTGSYGTYEKKSTSLGEVTNYIKAITSLMNKQGSEPYKMVQQAELTSKQFGVETILDLVKTPEQNKKSVQLALTFTQIDD